MMRSASVDLPWSTWEMMETLRMCFIKRRQPAAADARRRLVGFEE
jgi:hypothetical protein